MDKGNESISRKIGGSIKSNTISASQSYASTSGSATHLNGKTTTNFEGNNQPERPTLKWFAHDENIKNLIEMRCTANNAIKSRQLELAMASSATMSQATAATIDIVLFKTKNKSTISIESQATSEHLSKLIYNIEF